MHTHTEMTSLVVGHCRAAPVISRTKRQVPELIQSGISYFRKKKHNCVSVFLYACIKVKGWHIAVVRSLHAVIMGMNIMGI